MKPLSRLLNWLVLATMVVGALAACARQPVQEVVPAGVKVDLKAVFDKANAYYARGVADFEQPLVKLDADYKASDNEFRLGVRDLMSVAQYCFTNVAATESQIVEAALGDVSFDGIISALVTNNLTGEQATTECATLYANIADYVVTHRADLKNKYLARFSMAVDYEAYFISHIEVDIMNDLLTTYGDTSLVYQKLADAGIPGITDWSWLPTQLLAATHSDEAICRYYMSGEFMDSLPLATKLKFKGHETALASMFEATWIPASANGGQFGQCTMYRWAALRWFKRDSFGSGTRETQVGGDDSAIPTLPAP